MSEWADDCKLYRGKVLTGRYAHWCFEWDGLPIDETCIEWPCCSYEPEGITEEQKVEAKQVSERVHQEFDAAEEVARRGDDMLAILNSQQEKP